MHKHPDSTVSGMHVLITGASRGLGYQIARNLHEAGARLSLLARDLNKLNAIAKELGDMVMVYGADLTDEKQCENALTYFREKQGRIDILINNAGSGAYKPFAELSKEEVKQTFDVNINSLAQLTHSVIPDLKQSSYGCILNVASDLARRPLANMAVYSAAKHALAGFSHSIARELKSDGIRVMLLNPGIIDTWFGGKSEGDTPPPHGLNPADVAEVVRFMLTRPAYLLMDEVSLHPVNQDF